MNIIQIFLSLLFFTACASNIQEVKYVGKVNKTLITQKQYMDAVKTQYHIYRLKSGRLPLETEIYEINEKSWDVLTKNIILSDLYKKYKITITEKEVLDSLILDVPKIILESPKFIKDGDFDTKLYKQSLIDNEPYDLQWLKNRYYKIRIPFNKLKNKIEKKIIIKDSEIQKQYEIQHSIADVKIINYTLSDFDAGIISKAEKENFYNQNKKKYFVEANCKLDYLKTSVFPSQKDSLKAKTIIDSIYKTLNKGENFSLLASKFNSKESSDGFIGFLPLRELPGWLLEFFMKTSFNEHSKPFKIGSVWKIYKPIQKTKTLVKIQEISVEPEISKETKEIVFNKLIALRELAQELNLKTAADEMYYESKSTGLLTRQNSSVEGLGNIDNIVINALNSKTGKIFSPLYSELKKAYFLFQITEIHKEKYLPLIEVDTEITAEITQAKKKMEMEKFAENFDKSHYESEFVKAKENDIFTKEIHQFNFYSEVNSIYNEELNKIILTGKENVYLENDSLFIFKIENKRVEHDKINDTEKKSIQEKLFKKKKQTFFDEWFNDKIKSAKIKDWRKKIIQ